MIYDITVLSNTSSDKEEAIYEKYYLEVKADNDTQAREKGTIVFKQKYKELDIVWLIVCPKKSTDYNYNGLS